MCGRVWMWVWVRVWMFLDYTGWYHSAVSLDGESKAKHIQAVPVMAGNVMRWMGPVPDWVYRC
jgi:hypothetical protein